MATRIVLKNIVTKSAPTLFSAINLLHFIEGIAVSRQYL